jgi:hypothetical protein
MPGWREVRRTVSGKAGGESQSQSARLLPTSALPTSIIPNARSVTTLTGSCMRDRPFKRTPVNG